MLDSKDGISFQIFELDDVLPSTRLIILLPEPIAMETEVHFPDILNPQPPSFFACADFCPPYQVIFFFWFHLLARRRFFYFYLIFL